MRKKIAHRVQHSKNPEPEQVLPAVQSVPYCLAKLRQGVSDLAENLSGEREMARTTRDLLFQEMCRCVTWLLGRLSGGSARLGAEDFFLAWAGGKPHRRLRQGWEGGIAMEQDRQAIVAREPSSDWSADLTALRSDIDFIEANLDRNAGLPLRVCARLHIEMALRLKWVVAQAEIEQERRAYLATAALYAVSFAASAALDCEWHHQQKKTIGAKKVLDQLEIDGTIGHSDIETETHRPAETGAGANAISPEQAVNLSNIDPLEYREFCARPHFGQISGDTVTLDAGAVQEFWKEAGPLLERLAEESSVPVSDLREHMDGNLVVPYLVGDDGDRALFLAGGLRLEVEGAVRWVMLGMGVSEKTWPDLSGLLRIMRSAANDAGGLPVVIWAGGELPYIDGFQRATIPGLPSGTTLIDQQAA